MSMTMMERGEEDVVANILHDPIGDASTFLGSYQCFHNK